MRGTKMKHKCGYGDPRVIQTDEHHDELHKQINNLKFTLDELWAQVIKVAKGETKFEYASIKVKHGQTITKEQIVKAFKEAKMNTNEFWHECGKCSICGAPYYFKGWTPYVNTPPPLVTRSCDCPRFGPTIINSPPVIPDAYTKM